MDIMLILSQIFVFFHKIAKLLALIILHKIKQKLVFKSVLLPIMEIAKLGGVNLSAILLLMEKIQQGSVSQDVQAMDLMLNLKTTSALLDVHMLLSVILLIQ